MPIFRAHLVILSVLLAGLALPAGAASGAEPAAEPLVLSGRAFGEEAVLEVRDLPAQEAEATLRTAFERLRELQRLLDEAVRELNADAGAERTVAVAPPVVALLSRALQYCSWSQGALGPVGGTLAAHWQAAAGNPAPPPVPAALAASAACDRLVVDPDSGSARVAAGSRVRLEPFAAGFAVDRTVEALRELGAGNGLVRIGRVQRGFGPGPAPIAGPGWPAVLPAFEGYDQPFDVVRLDHQSLAVVWRADWPSHHPLHVDHRTGEPPDETWATAAVAELAIDAQALAVAGVVLGPREGIFRMARLQPPPSVLWLLGRGQARPLRRDLNWSDLHAP